MLFQWISFHAGPRGWWNRINQQLWAFRVPWSLDLQEVVFENSPGDHETQSIRCQCRIPWTLHPSCIHLLRWSLERSVKQTWTGSQLLTIFIAYMNIIFIIKVTILVFIKWSYRSFWLYWQLSLKWLSFLKKKHMLLFISVLGATPNNIPLKCRCLIRYITKLSTTVLGANFCA